MMLLRLLCSKLLSAVGVATTVVEPLTPPSRLVRLAVRRSCHDVLWYVCLTALVFVLQLFDVFWSVCSLHVISICCSHVLMFSLSRNNMHVGIVGFLFVPHVYGRSKRCWGPLWHTKGTTHTTVRCATKECQDIRCGHPLCDMLCTESMPNAPSRKSISELCRYRCLCASTTIHTTVRSNEK